MRQIYAFYATNLETRRLGLSGYPAMKLLLNIDHCKEMLQDFHLLPQLIDVQTFYRQFRSVKLWEWDIADYVLYMSGKQQTTTIIPNHRSSSNASHHQLFDQHQQQGGVLNSNVSVSGGVGGGGGGHHHNQQASGLAAQYDPWDILGTIGHFSISFM
jgi:hypothetical protein